MYLKYTAKDAEWKKIVSHFETLRLFGRLALRKGKKGERLSAGELDVLFRIALGITPQTPGMLSADMGASKTIVSRFTDSLCKKELIQKQFDQIDGRSYSLALTEKGNQELIQLCHYYLDPVYLIREKMGKESFEELLRLIRQANHILVAEQEESLKNMKQKQKEV